MVAHAFNPGTEGSKLRGALPMLMLMWAGGPDVTGYLSSTAPQPVLHMLFTPLYNIWTAHAHPSRFQFKHGYLQEVSRFQRTLAVTLSGYQLHFYIIIPCLSILLEQVDDSQG